MYSNLYKFVASIGYFVFFSTSLFANPISVASLTCEYRVNPLGIDVTNPRFSWILSSDERGQRQTAYELIVSTDMRKIRKGIGGTWSAGKVDTDQSIHVVYEGEPLEPFTRYFWRVRVYDKDGGVSRWSEINWFETAALTSGDWQGDWITDGRSPFAQDADFYQDDRNPLFRKSFDAKKRIASARMYISGLGYYEAYLNGEKVGDRLLEPGWTAYDEQVLYSVYDVTDQLRRGANSVGVMLGNGWYNPLPLRFWGVYNWRDALATGRPKVKAMIRMEYKDGSVDVIDTDHTWQTAPGPIVRNSIYLGEHHDARLEDPNWCTVEGSLAGWTGATVVDGPKGVMTVQQQPPVRITKVVKPIEVNEVEPGVFVYDMGQNFAGVARIRVKGPAGTKITLRYGEDRYPDGHVNLMTTVAGQIKAGNGGPGAPEIAWQEDSYILKGGEVEVWAPKFTFHGFRYVEVSGWPGQPTLDDIEGLRMSADLEKAGYFSSSNDLFNKLDNVIQWTFLSNVFSVLSDCPAREKLAYGGDILCGAETFMFNYDMSQFYTKTIRDHANDQRPLGGITETAPFVGIADDGPGDGSGPLGYQAGYPYLIKKMYDFYGDKRVIEQYYASLQKQIEFLNARTSNNLFSTDLGDHESLEPKNKPLTASIFYHLHAKLMAEFAGILGRSGDERKYTALAARIEKAISAEFVNKQSGIVGSGTQSDQLFALWGRVVDDADIERVYQLLNAAFDEKDWHVSTGIFGTKMMFDVFRERDDNELAYRVANQRTFPGWGHMVENGATTIWETWKYSDNTYSQNHPMFGSIGEWFYRSLLGINEAAPGFKRIKIKPQPAGDLRHAEGEFKSVHGTIGSSWRIAENGFELDVDIPVNTQAEIWIPRAYGTVMSEGGKALDQAEGITRLRDDEDYTVVLTGSGHYRFKTAK
ncbi:family 78 glycoside hydrolase catalytic domain [Parapedobacter sp. 10938]|uniref:family 78 glycoside hydrolase catalytic domain n=1 Tax=Parapedobacter flavus TaxID=3110225 RepID=UPI002DBC90D9|nr:family 78 glycoside hydrolase catalytic domain [Parapedobacter sp. 10938]MEC3881652.1 family 78 glycoside hydrolase catalytic domain [Parapedobacter sp. 10938]